MFVKSGYIENSNIFINEYENIETNIINNEFDLYDFIKIIDELLKQDEKVELVT